MGGRALGVGLVSALYVLAAISAGPLYLGFCLVVARVLGFTRQADQRRRECS